MRKNQAASAKIDRIGKGFKVAGFTRMATKCTDYNFHEIEPHWQGFWEQNQTFRATDDVSKPKYYVLDMFTYPSGAGLHIGHPEGYTGTDIIAR